MKLAKTDRGEKGAGLAEVVENVWSVPHCVGAQTKVVVRVGSPDVGVQRGRPVVGEMQWPVQYCLVQRGQAVIIQQVQVGPELDQHDDSAELAMEDGPVQRRVARLSVLSI